MKNYTWSVLAAMLSLFACGVAVGKGEYARAVVWLLVIAAYLHVALLQRQLSEAREQLAAYDDRAEGV